MSINGPLTRRQADELLDITSAIRMQAESAYEAFNAKGPLADAEFVQANLRFWQQTMKSLNWIDSIIRGRIKD